MLRKPNGWTPPWRQNPSFLQKASSWFLLHLRASSTEAEWSNSAKRGGTVKRDFIITAYLILTHPDGTVVSGGFKRWDKTPSCHGQDSVLPWGQAGRLVPREWTKGSGSLTDSGERRCSNQAARQEE